MKRLVIVFSFLAVFSNAYAGPMIEVYTCELNEGKTLVDANEMVANFAEMLEEAGLRNSYFGRQLANPSPLSASQRAQPQTGCIQIQSQL